MSWMSKMLNYFLNEKEEEIEEHDIKPKPKQVNRNYEKIRGEMEARVAYQYPEGKFRFPIIPDENTSSNSKTESKRQRKQAPHSPEKQKRDFSRPADMRKKQDYKLSSKKIVQKGSDQFEKNPFKPTEIPSPIYGFHSREDQELLDIQALRKKRAMNESNRLNGDLHLNSEAEDHYSSFSEIHMRSEKDERMTPYNHEEASLEPQTNGKEEAISYDSSSHHGMEENTEQELPETDDGLQVQENGEYNDGETIEQDNRINEFEDEDDLTEVQQEAASEDKVICKQESNVPIEQLETKQVQDDKNEESKTINLKGTHPRRPKKSSGVPFNVMMLKKDREKLRERTGNYQFPPLNYLRVPPNEIVHTEEWVHQQKDLLDLTLKNFNVRAKVVHVTQGPSVTRLEVQPEPGVKVNKITNLSDDIKLSLSAKDIRIEAPIPGKNTIGIEVPNKQSKMVFLREIIRSQAFRNDSSPLTVALGLDIAGQPVITDLKKMPHGLIAGATGSGKSVCINTMLVSLLYKASPHEVKLLLIDPKMVELAPYNHIPHLVSPVITDVKAATAALKWAVEEMERRYELFAHTGVRDIARYNEMVKKHQTGEHLPYLVVVIDELADLMMVAPNDVEEAICRIAQKARACGIHLIVATQRPSVDVITGLIKANIPSRIAFSVSSQVDSRTIIDTGGAEKLLGKGDMLFLENGSSKPARIQGNFVSDDEIEHVVDHVRKQMKPVFLFEQEELVRRSTVQTEGDELFLEACEFVINQNGASTSSLQRRFRIGYNRAARLMDLMEENGVISEAKGSKPRDILISEEDLENIQESNVY
ncbi:DNA translocase FtsK [Metabacillus arenae]|uniref:DNA translocase FtsK n=1 Tax=Metabacillus arenae TaxID=2771434 RepID=A0A926NLD2_9BACI|nr:DNA translocase FtsK [Metabacillus arenae]MBD1380157.1 DNA translocase FtsK [Metabacillus arenae]